MQTNRLTLTACLAGFLLLFVGSTATLHPAQASSSFTPRGVSPYGYTLQTSFGTVTPTISDNMTSWGVCATDPGSTIFGISCWNGSNNATIIFNVTGFETSQKIYQFQVNYYGNEPFQLLFVGIQPVAVMVSPSAQTSYTGRMEAVKYVGAGTVDSLCVAYVGTYCSGPNPPPPNGPPPNQPPPNPLSSSPNWTIAVVLLSGILITSALVPFAVVHRRKSREFPKKNALSQHLFLGR
jgi:hypothetical protein